MEAQAGGRHRGSRLPAEVQWRMLRWGCAWALIVPAVAWAQTGVTAPVTAGQRAIAQQVAARGVPLSALAPEAPDVYQVRRGDTLWGIAGKFLREPWHWPQLWGMNLQQIHNPNRIYPGQELYLERVGDRAYLRTARGSNGEGPTVHVTPRNRIEMLKPEAIAAIPLGVVRPFLTEPLVVDGDEFERAPRIVALDNDMRVLISQGDRAYARGPAGSPLELRVGQPRDYRLFRTATPLRDPESGEILGFEGQYVGQAKLVRGESRALQPVDGAFNPPAGGEGSAHPSDARPRTLPVPATVDVTASKEEIRPGDRLLPEPPPEYTNFVPRAPDFPVDARIVSVYGDSVRFVGGNQVVGINKGAEDGMEPGQVLAVMTAGQRMIDPTVGGHQRLQLPSERNGLALVFKTFPRVSYALIVSVRQAAQVGDRMVNPN